MTTTPSSLEHQCTELPERLRAWLASGELQSPAGAFCAWRNEATGALAFEYPEITGYALTWLAGREGVADREREAGARAARWVTSRLAAGNRSARAGWDEGAIYTFDLAMIAAGLISFGRLVEDHEMETCGRATAAHLAALTDAEGRLPAVDPSGPASTRAPEWANQGRPHLIKCVQAMLLAGEEDAASRLTTSTSELQREDGSFVTQAADGWVMLHPTLYAVEGLWMWASAHADGVVLERARLATEWTWRHQLPSGGFPRFVARAVEGAPAPEQCDVTAQAVRAALLLDFQPPGLERAVDRLTGLTHSTETGAALVYQPESQQAHLNSWVTMFGAQALELATGRRDAVNWKTLV